MGIVRSRATVEENKEFKSQAPSDEVEQPLLKKLCPFVDTPIGDNDEEECESDSGAEEYEGDVDIEESESDSEAEEHEGDEDMEEYESDSGAEGQGGDEGMEESESDSQRKEDGSSADDLSESESVGDGEGGNLQEALALSGKEEQGKELISEVGQPLIKNIDTPEGVEPELDSAEEEERSSSRDTINNNQQTKVVNGKEDDESSESESEDTAASNEHDNMDLGEKLTNGNHKQSMVVEEEEDDDSSGSESEGDTEASNDHEDLDLGGEEEKKSRGVQSSTTIDKNGESRPRESCSEFELEQVKKLCLSSTRDSDKEDGKDEEKSESDPEEEEENSSSGDMNNNDKQTMMSRGIQSRATIDKNGESRPQESCSEFELEQVKKSCLSSAHDSAKEDGKDEEKYESDPEEEEENSSSGDMDNNDNQKQTIVGNEEEDDESESEGDTEGSSEREDLDLSGKKERSNVLPTESKVGKSLKKPQGSKSKIAVNKPLGHNTPSASKISEKANGEKILYDRWSDDDVIILLEGLVKVMDRVGMSKGYVRALHDLIGDSIHFKPSINQLREKIRRLKIMYKRDTKESHGNLTPHGARVVELCKMVWGNEPKTKNVEQSQIHQASRSFRIDYCSQPRELLKKGFILIKEPKEQSGFGEDWIKFQLQEIQLYQEQLSRMKKYLDQVTHELQASLRSCKKAD